MIERSKTVTFVDQILMSRMIVISKCALNVTNLDTKSLNANQKMFRNVSSAVMQDTI